MGKIVKKYMIQPKFIADIFIQFIKQPKDLYIFSKGLYKTRSIGKSLKMVMPHQI